MSAEDFEDGLHSCRFCGASVEVVQAELVFRHAEPVCAEFEGLLERYLPGMAFERFTRFLDSQKKEVDEWDAKKRRDWNEWVQKNVCPGREPKAVCPRRPGGH